MPTLAQVKTAVDWFDANQPDFRAYAPRKYVVPAGYVNPRGFGLMHKVLLVEDEFDTLELLGRSLTRAGYACLLAQTKAQALEFLASHADIALVITDIVLGAEERAGLELFRPEQRV